MYFDSIDRDASRKFVTKLHNSLLRLTLHNELENYPEIRICQVGIEIEILTIWIKVVFLFWNISITKDMFLGFQLLQYDKSNVKILDILFSKGTVLNLHLLACGAVVLMTTEVLEF